MLLLVRLPFFSLKWESKHFRCLFKILSFTFCFVMPEVNCFNPGNVRNHFLLMNEHRTFVKIFCCLVVFWSVSMAEFSDHVDELSVLLRAENLLTS